MVDLSHELGYTPEEAFRGNRGVFAGSVGEKLPGEGTNTAWWRKEKAAADALRKGATTPSYPMGVPPGVRAKRFRDKGIAAADALVRDKGIASGGPRPSWSKIPTELQTVTPASIADAEAAEVAAKKAPRTAALKKAAAKLINRAAPPLAAADAYAYGQWAQPGMAQQGAIIDAPSYLQSGEGYPVDPRNPEWLEEPVQGKRWGLSDIDWSPEELLRPFLPRKGHTGGVGLGGTPEQRGQRARELAAAIRESLNHRGNKMTEKCRTEKVREAAQLELPGLETPEACEPADGVEDLSAQLAQMVVDSEVPPEHFNDLMELIYDKVAAGLENIGVEDEEGSDDYRRTSIGFMEDLRNATLKILMEQQPLPNDDTSGTQQAQVAGKEAASEEAQSAAQSANPGTPQASGTQAGHAAAQAAMRKVSQQGGDVFTGGEESATVGTARKEDDKLNEAIAFNRFAKLAGI